MNRKLDAAIAEALGYDVQDWTDRPVNPDFWMHNGDLRWYKVPKYSTDGNAMLQLDAEMRERGWVIDIGHYANCWMVNYLNMDSNDKLLIGKGQAVNELLARALAAYNALTGKVWGTT